jgi:hypothetical protein
MTTDSDLMLSALTLDEPVTRAELLDAFDRTTRVIPFNKWTAIEVPEYWMNEVEYFYINKYRPPFNIKLRP